MLDLASIPAELRCPVDPGLARLEDAALTASQPREQAIYDGWLLRYANGKAKRARSVNLIGAGDRPLETKLAYCAEFYRRRGVPFILRMTPFSRPLGIDAALDRLGYVAAEDTRVMVAPLAVPPAVAAPGGPVETLDQATFGTVLAGLHGLDPVRAATERDRFAHAVFDGIYLAICEDGRAVACGSAVVDANLVGIYGMVTAASHRGRGLATRLVEELLRHACVRGCTTAYLQVEAGNAPARRAYSKFGFRDGYAYWYRWPPGEGKT
ncbi:MAG TPA: GNAT family N-acetyltransferase [Burkholderiaceae bacterium]|nr:GNAT family N-acetyltransferase [Burkholderiaceae bacterium]